MNASILMGVLLGYGVLGYLSCKLAIWFLWCENCQQERKQDDWPKANCSREEWCKRERPVRILCKRCHAALDARSPEMLLGPDAMV